MSRAPRRGPAGSPSREYGPGKNPAPGFLGVAGMRRPAEPCHIARYCRSLRCLCGSPPAGTSRMIRSILPAARGIAIMRLPQWAFQACSHYFQAVVVPGGRGRRPDHYPVGLAGRRRSKSAPQLQAGAVREPAAHRAARQLRTARHSEAGKAEQPAAPACGRRRLAPRNGRVQGLDRPLPLSPRLSPSRPPSRPRPPPLPFPRRPARRRPAADVTDQVFRSPLRRQELHLARIRSAFGRKACSIEAARGIWQALKHLITYPRINGILPAARRK